MPVVSLVMQFRRSLRAADASIKNSYVQDFCDRVKQVGQGDSLGALAQAYSTASAVAGSPVYNSQLVFTDGLAYATSAITWTAAGSNGDTVTIGATVFTAVASAPTAIQYVTGVDQTATAANFATAVNANTTTNKYVSATSALGVATITFLVPGVMGNAVPLAETSGVASWAAAFPTGGASNALVTIAG